MRIAKRMKRYQRKDWLLWRYREVRELHKTYNIAVHLGD